MVYQDEFETNLMLLDELARDHQLRTFLPLEASHIQKALFVLWNPIENYGWMLSVTDFPIDEAKAREDLNSFEFRCLFDTVSTFGFLEGIRLYEPTTPVTWDKDSWIIHHSKDPLFPSNPHAHNFEENITLDLRNGDCYRYREIVRRLSKKQLLEVRKKAERKHFTMPVLLV